MAEDVVRQANFKMDRVDREKVSTNPYPGPESVTIKAKHQTLNLKPKPYPKALIAVMGFPGGRFGLWGLRFGLSLWGSMSLWVSLVPEESV